MTHNQSELQQNKVLKDLRDILETRHAIVKGSDEFTPYVVRLYQYITANYTPTSDVEERERLARIDELYAVGNTFFPSGVSDGSSNGDWLEQRISELKKENGNG